MFFIVINIFMSLYAYIYTELFHKYTTYERKFSFNGLLHKSKMHILVEVCIYMYLFHFANSAYIIFIEMYMKYRFFATTHHSLTLLFHIFFKSSTEHSHILDICD